MYTYLLYYQAGNENYNSDHRRLLSFNKKISSHGDILHIEESLREKLGMKYVNLLSFSKLEDSFDEYVYSLDKEWK